ncbi:MAG: hypothetical protein JRJ35_13760 [Deltaproteobacteria bacterium]|nr:hypothetical protein [Deltaproteobacteria bacterium]
MTKKLQELALSFFLAVCGISMLLGILWLKPVLETQKQLIEETRINQEKIMQGAEQTRAILTELGYATAVIAMVENRMIQPADANRMIEDSVKVIESHSERLGKLARLINEFRINEQTRRR